MLEERKFNGDRLKSARIYRGKTISQIAEEIDVTKQAISQFEKGKSNPGFETLIKLTQNLDFPKEYFYEYDRENIKIGNTFFRAQASITKKEESAYSEKIMVFSKLYKFIEQYINFPKFNIPELIDDVESNEEIEELAMNLRRYWGVGDKPIVNLVNLMEKNGFKITSFNTNNSKVDAFTQPQQNRLGDIEYFIALGNDKNSAVRRHFDLAHELGHIILHYWAEDTSALSKEEYKAIENQANEFASAFLLPKNSFLKDLIYPTNLEFYIELKKKWRVSIGAMMIRAYKLNAISYNQYQYMVKQASKKGWRTKEPLDDELKLPRPILIRKSIEMLIENDVFTKRRLVEEIHNSSISISRNEIEFLLGLDKDYLRDDEIKSNVISLKL